MDADVPRSGDGGYSEVPEAASLDAATSKGCFAERFMFC